MNNWYGRLAITATLTLLTAGCTRIVSVEPPSGPPGQCVYIKTAGMFGDPAKQALKWDGQTIRDPFPGSFTIPAVASGGALGQHKITLVDKLDSSEAFLLFPIFRLRTHTIKYTVTEQ